MFGSGGGRNWRGGRLYRTLTLVGRGLPLFNVTPAVTKMDTTEFETKDQLGHGCIFFHELILFVLFTCSLVVSEMIQRRGRNLGPGTSAEREEGEGIDWKESQSRSSHSGGQRS